MDGKSLLIGALVIVVAVVGYLYWDKQRNTVEIKLPSVSIQKN
jgi:predicted negative regulator of RcsB-dependent stress response